MSEVNFGGFSFQERNLTMGRTRLLLISAVILAAGYLLFLYDDLFGPKDSVIYLWPLPVVLIMAIAAIIILYQVILSISRFIQK